MNIIFMQLNKIIKLVKIISIKFRIKNELSRDKMGK